MKIIIGLVYACSSTLVFNPAYANKIYCPKVIFTQQKLQTPVPTWEIFAVDPKTVHNLSGVIFYAHHPDENAKLAPTHRKAYKLTWNFSGDEIWLACTYLNTDIKLIKKLKLTTSACVVKYAANFNEVIAIECS